MNRAQEKASGFSGWRKKSSRSSLGTASTRGSVKAMPPVRAIVAIEATYAPGSRPPTMYWLGRA